ncbi:MAG: ribonuclease HIII [Ktedonobacteraceae bacterium]|nr:ribonuclease HIII [Ktedonobacteraceae bacterium]
MQAVEAVELGERWIGTDESGKGDFFGPLVAAAVLVDGRIAALLTELGVRDSKNLSDKQNIDLAAKIYLVCGANAQVVPIPPVRYNTLYDQMTREGKNLNTLLAWAHTRALENLLTAFPQNRITVIIDQFADEHYIQDKLMASARSIELHLVQLPKAEANIAVAAASILARAGFLDALNRLSREYGVTLPKGASDPSIITIGQQIVARGGQPALAKVAKLHFKTTAKILG